jgi:hypothetical protein
MPFSFCPCISENVLFSLGLLVRFRSHPVAAPPKIMFTIENNMAKEVATQTFKELGYVERDLQKWIISDPSMLGEELLIIQEEFDRWTETRERFDLLALDQDGNLVIIENKRDDSGTDVTWQALKYVSYCSTLTSEQIVQIFQDYLDKLGTGKSAEAELREFFYHNEFASILDQGDQRIILVAANFRREVTSTAIWLFERDIKIKCIKVTPYKLGENIVIAPEQIIPVKEAEEYLMQLAEKRRAKNIATAANALRGRLKFSELGIEPGEELVYVRDVAKTCTVVDGEQSVKYDGRVFPTLVSLAKELFQEDGKRPHAPLLFRYGTDLLADIHKEYIRKKSEAKENANEQS